MLKTVGYCDGIISELLEEGSKEGDFVGTKVG
jgi:hypothetical protein